VRREHLEDSVNLYFEPPNPDDTVRATEDKPAADRLLAMLSIMDGQITL
jgi:hypothetical protein